LLVSLYLPVLYYPGGKRYNLSLLLKLLLFVIKLPRLEYEAKRGNAT